LIATSDTTTQRTAEECGRSAAQIAFAARFAVRQNRQKLPMFGRDPQGFSQGIGRGANG
jgi:hypothetical protein